MYLIVNNQVKFQTNSAVQSINKGINAILIEQLSTFHVFMKVYSLTVSKYSTVYHADLEAQ
jgi:hypothetical protein